MITQGEIVPPLRAGSQRGPVDQRSSDIDASEDTHSLAIDTVNNDEVTPTWTPRSESPAMMVTPPGFSTFTMFSERKRQSSEITIKPVPDRPRLRRKANTAPAGALQMLPGVKPHFKPQPPRRAISSTTAHAFSRSDDRDRRRPSKSLLLTPTELVKLRTMARKGKLHSGGRARLKSKPLVWRMSSPPKTFEMPPELKPSFSEKKRVKTTLNLKKMEMIKVNLVDLELTRLPSTSASSIVLTPNVFYKRPTSVRTKTPPTPAGSSTPLRGMTSRSATPLGSGTPLRCSSPLRNATPHTSPTPSKSSLDSVESPRSRILSTRAKHFSLPMSPVAQRVPWRSSIVMESTRRKTTPVPREKGPVYIPGPIQLEERLYETPQRNSIADLELSDNGVVPQAKRFSDLVALDGIAMYFEALGVASEASEACLDRYWLRTKMHSHADSGTSARSVQKSTPVLSALVPSPPSGGIATTFEGIFRTQKALRDEERSAPSSGTASRRKPLLRQLLKSSRKAG